MTASERRENIMKELSASRGAISASALAAKMAVSRQVIVGDIALLRAGGNRIAATPRGYELTQEDVRRLHQIVCRHSKEAMRDELTCLVDNGCAVLDVSVDHPIYGMLSGQLKISSRYEIDLFMEEVDKSTAQPLSALTDGVHMHLISCPDDSVFERVTRLLREKGLLISAE